MTEHIFGYHNTRETLQTIGREHTNLSGFVTLVREYPDQTITDRFEVTEKYRTAEDVEGNAYDWYYIDQHYRYTDKTPPLREEITETRGELEEALCEVDATADERLAAIEDALCEIDAANA